MKPKKKNKPIDITVRSFQVRADTVCEETRSIEAVIATEKPVMAFDLRRFEPVLEVLRMDGIKFPDQTPLLDTHDRSSIKNMIGSTRDFRVEHIDTPTYKGDALVARNYYDSDDGGVGDKAWSLIRGGHLKDNSVGYQVEEHHDIEPGERANVGGRDYEAPADMVLRVSFVSMVKENSNCPIGADDIAKMRAETFPEPNAGANPRTSQTKQGQRNMNPKQMAFLHTRGLDSKATAEEAKAWYAEELTDEQRTECDAITVEPKQTEAKRSDVDPVQAARKAALDAIAEERKAETARCESIRSEGKESGVESEVVERCITEGLDISESRAAFLKAVRTERPTAQFGINKGAGVSLRADHLSAGCLIRSGRGDVATAEYGEDITQQAHENFRDLTLIDVVRTALHMQGHNVPHSTQDTIRAGFSTGALTTVLGSTAGKMQLRGFSSAPGSWREWCNIISRNDFKSHPMARMNVLGEFEEVGNGGEVTYSSRSEDAESIQLKTYAKNFSVTRQDIINDDMNVFTKIPEAQGRQAAMRISKLVYTHLLSNPTMGDGTALFHADHSNLNTSQALSAGNLSESLEAFYAQTGPDGEPCDIAAAILLVPTQLVLTARQLVESARYLPTGSTDLIVGENNPNKGELNKVVNDQRLGNSGYTGYDVADWYIMADPSQSDTVAVAFLNGQQTPTLETFETQADYMGVTFRGSLDFAVKAAEWRTMQKNTA